MFAEIVIENEAEVYNLGAQLRAVGANVQRFGGETVRTNAYRLQAAVRAHAEGRPGPRKITGDYWNSIQVSLEGQGTLEGVYSSRTGRISRGWEAEVYTDAPFARRLEFGFVGMDSRGRYYDQPPYPHWGPASAEVEERFFTDMEVAVDLSITYGRTAKAVGR